MCLDAKKNDGSNSRSKNHRIVNKNVKTEFVGFGNSVFLKNTKKVLKHGDLEVDNTHSFYLGRHIIRNGDRKQKISRAYDPMSEFYHLNRKVFDENGIFVDKNVTMSGCFKSNKETLQRTMIPEFDTFNSSLPTMDAIKRYENAVKTVIRKLKIVELAKVPIDGMKFASFNKLTYPGFHLAEYFGHSNKDEAAGDAFKIAECRWKRLSRCAKKNRVIDRNDIFPNTYVVGARNKRDYHYEDGDVVTSRAVHMPEFHSEINSSPWIEQITNHIRTENKGPVYIGNSMISSERLHKDLKDGDLIGEGDWRRFDSGIYVTNIIIGLSILRLYYPHDDREIDAHFIGIFDSIGIKDYITPGGHLYRMIHGIPSGVNCTSLLGSVINLVNLVFCTEGFDQKQIKYIVGGDDFLVAPKNCINFDKLVDRMLTRAEEIGQVFKFLLKKSLKAKNILDRPCFFKYTLDRNEPVVYPTSMLERVFLPWNKRYDSDLKILSFLQDLIPSLGAPRSFHVMFYYFYLEIFKRATGLHKTIREVYELHDGIYKKVMSGEIECKNGRERFFKNFSEIEFNYVKSSQDLLWFIKPSKSTVAIRKIIKTV